MADKIKKFLARLSKRELETVQTILLDISNGQLDGLDIKPLKGKKDMYRVRKGRVRVIFLSDGDKTAILSIGNRDDQTYRNF